MKKVIKIKGIDISEMQGLLNESAWNKIKASGIEFVIIRVGYTGYGKAKSKQKDYRFENNYAMAKKVGMPIGVYWYSCAVTEEEAIEEAKLTLEYLKGKQLEYPIFIDTEDNHDIEKYSSKSQYSIGKTALTKVVKAYCEYIEKQGNYVGIYASSSWFKNQLVDSKLSKYDHWIAQWSSSEPTESHGMWQYSSKGKVNGISGNVDMDYAYKDYPSIIKSQGLNGYDAEYVEPTPQPTNPNKTIDELAQEVIDGKWGNDKDRLNRLTEAGYNYDEVQNRVNEILHSQKETNKSTIKINDKVKVLNNITYDGKKFIKWFSNYDVLEVKSDRVVIGKGKIVTCAINIKNIEKL